MRQIILFRVASDPVARICSGVNPIIIPADIVEAEEARYLGGGALVRVPDLEQLVNGTAARAEITVSGVSAETLRLAVEDAASVKGAKVHIGIAYQDDAWQITEVEWVAVFRADSLTVSTQSTGRGRSRSITLSVGTDFTDRSRAPIAFWTDADQRRRAPTDRFFDQVALITAGTSRRFGPKE